MEQSNLAIFEQLFEGHSVRVYGTEEEPLFVAKDICNVLEIKNSRDALSEFDNDELIKDGVGNSYPISFVDSLGRTHQKPSLLTERGIYRIAFLSRTKPAKTFRKFVCELLYNLRTKRFSLVDNRIRELEAQNKQLLDELIKVKSEPKKREGHIYIIECQACNMYYIGSAWDATERFKRHQSDITAKDTYAKHMLDCGRKNMILKEENIFKHEVLSEDELHELEGLKQKEYREIYGDDRIINKNDPSPNKSKRVNCSICNKEMNRSSLKRHLSAIHEIE